MLRDGSVWRSTPVSEVLRAIKDLPFRANVRTHAPQQTSLLRSSLGRGRRRCTSRSSPSEALGDVRPQHAAARQAHDFPGIVGSEPALSQIPFGASISSVFLRRPGPGNGAALHTVGRNHDRAGSICRVASGAHCAVPRRRSRRRAWSVQSINSANGAMRQGKGVGHDVIRVGATL